MYGKPRTLQSCTIQAEYKYYKSYNTVHVVVFKCILENLSYLNIIYWRDYDLALPSHCLSIILKFFKKNSHHITIHL